MKKFLFYFLSLSSILVLLSFSKNSNNITALEIHTDSTVTDFDGNVYHTFNIGTQVWLKENLKSIHYSDGTVITGVMSYNNSDSLANIYGRLYTWNATMRNSTNQGVQGVCPAGYHVPTDSEWTVLGNYLGGNSIAGGKLKETDTAHWYSPNTGATNSTGFTALGGGEWENGNFQYIKMFGVFWSSTQTSSTQAKYRYIEYSSIILNPYTWNKSLAYSVRCIKNNPSSYINGNTNSSIFFELKQNYPNPFNPSTNIKYQIRNNGIVTLKVFNALGQEIETLVNEKQNAGTYEITFDASKHPSGIYYYRISTDKFSDTKKMLLVK
jgi:uncharacterized protein (TIGR02145 family)